MNFLIWYDPTVTKEHRECEHNFALCYYRTAQYNFKIMSLDVCCNELITVNPQSQKKKKKKEKTYPIYLN